MIRLTASLRAALAARRTVLVPGAERAWAVRLAVAAEALGAGARVWPTPDVLTPGAWLRRSYQQRAAEEPGLPRLLGAAEQWLLWRRATQHHAPGHLLALAGLDDRLRAAQELAQWHALRMPPADEMAGAEPALLAAVSAAVAAECRRLRAVGSPAELAAALGVANSPPLLAGLPEVPALLARLGVQALGEEGSDGAAPRVTLAADDEEELRLIAAWSRQWLARDPDARLLVLLPGSGAGERERLARLIAQEAEPGRWLAGEGEPLVGLEGGVPLLQQPMVRHALGLLACCAGEEPSEEEAAELAHSPYLDLHGAGIAPASVLSAIEARVRARASESVAPLPRLEERCSPRRWAEAARGALEAAGWPGAAPDSAAQQLAVRGWELLDELGQLARLAPEVSGREALALLRERAAVAAHRPLDADPPVRIAAALADPLVLYDAIWVARLNADCLPGPAVPDPFLPRALQVAAGVPGSSSALRLAESQELLQRLPRRCAELVLSAPLRRGDAELVPAPLLRAFGRIEPQVALAPQPWLAARLQRPGLLASVPDEDGLPWRAGAVLPRGTYLLERQNDCPFRAYVELRLAARELRTSSPGVDPDLHGRLLHGTLQRLWERLGTQAALAALDPAARRELIGDCIEHAFAQEAARGLDATPASGARERRRLARLVGELCEFELRRPDFVVEGIERDLGLRLGGEQLAMRIDRIDRLAGGARLVIDYKTGARVPMDLLAARPTHVQLLAYLCALVPEVQGVAILTVRTGELRFTGLGIAAGAPRGIAALAPDGEDANARWQAQCELWRQRLESLATGFKRGLARVDPRPGACRRCHLTGVCRRPEGLDDEPEPEVTA